MRHPFDLDISELKSLNLDIEDISNDEAEKVSGGADATTLALGEEGGGEVTTLALGEEGGEMTTEALGEEGGGGQVSTKALGEEGGIIITKAWFEHGGFCF
ncbi:MAG: hypothetical protein IGS49_22005 [Chlorogloeopsis fritschii C42_A2020_084]|jgi:hypothetical protein|uniref:hypothetical protein n=1 Tax=Chlorogloeopsis fritschii TaxID=1124 RepID=UPI0019EC6E7B|nr:hypothetical protein [Chlorogloeopsis fritschii]MBF2008042.1 hypothetical protein [Chlorogloeopsis fritschii C42_A2020_084]